MSSLGNRRYAQFFLPRDATVLLRQVVYLSVCPSCPRAPFDHIWAMVWSGARRNITI